MLQEKHETQHHVKLSTSATSVHVPETGRTNSTFDLQFDEEIMGRQEALAQLLKKEEKINELEAEVHAFRAQVLHLFHLGFFSPCRHLLVFQ